MKETELYEERERIIMGKRKKKKSPLIGAKPPSQYFKG